jgi:hypothetical protein
MQDFCAKELDMFACFALYLSDCKRRGYGVISKRHLEVDSSFSFQMPDQTHLKLGTPLGVLTIAHRSSGTGTGIAEPFDAQNVRSQSVIPGF